MKAMVAIGPNEVPVYFEKKGEKLLTQLIQVLETKLVNGKRTVKKFLDSLDSVEIVGKDAMLYSKYEMDPLLISLC